MKISRIIVTLFGLLWVCAANAQNDSKILLKDSSSITFVVDQRIIGYFKAVLQENRYMEKNPWTLKFEILDVYPGERYDDTVISELYFDGIDVH